MKISISDSTKYEDSLTLISHGNDDVAIFNTVNNQQSLMIIVSLNSLRNAVLCLMESRDK